MMGGQLAHALIDRFLEKARAVEVIRTGRGVLELERPVVSLQVLLDGLEEDERVPAFFFSSSRRHTRSLRDWSSDVCSSDLADQPARIIFGRNSSASART